MPSTNIQGERDNPPDSLKKLIARKGVMAALDNASGTIRVTAPSGYGKTVSVSQWICERRKKAVWLSLRGYDDAPAIFYRRFCETLMEARPESEALNKYLYASGFGLSPVEHTCEAVLKMRDEEAGSERELVIVIDDLQNITNPEILKSLPRVLKMLPGNFTAVLISQDGVAGEGKQTGRVCAIGTETLKFSLDEVRECFERFGHNLGYQESRLVKGASEGWPVAVHVIASVGALPGRCAKEDILEKYFEDYFWKHLSSGTRSFLQTVCQLDDFTPALCSRITGRRDCSDILENLVSRNAMFSKNASGEYFCRKPFLNFIREKRRSQVCVSRDEILLAASEHYFDAGDIRRAIYYGFKGDITKSLARQLRGLAMYIPGGLSAEERMKSALLLLEGHLPVSLGRMDDLPYQLIYSAWQCFLSGDADGVGESVRAIEEALPKIEVSKAVYARPAIMARFLDPETSLEGFASICVSKFAALPEGKLLPLEAIASGFPFLHRGARDFSGIELKDGDMLVPHGASSGKTWDDFAVIESCIAGGIMYEKNELPSVLELAERLCAPRSGPAGLLPQAPELGFFARMLKAAALDAMDDEFHATSCRMEISDYILKEGALHLYPGFLAYVTKLRLQNGDRKAASEWLSNYFADERGAGLGGMTLHLTTARAMMIERDPESARAFINRLICLARSFKRPLDEAELLILLGILEWHRGMRKNAVKPIEEAVLILQKFKYIRTAADEGFSVFPMIKRLITVSSRRDYSGKVDPIYLKELYLAAYARSKKYAGIAAAMKTKPVRLSRQQALMIKLLSQGYRNSDISAETGLTMNTVKVHTALAYKKLGVSNSAEAVLRAKELGLLDGATRKDGASDAILTDDPECKPGAFYELSKGVKRKDNPSDLLQAERRGLARGLALGVEKGERLRSAAIAKSMLNDSVPVARIATYTGLSETEIESIKNE
jgi:LuxR family maltose regulon positive regulatory protein